jgi:capsular polysaccharide export protein
MKIILLQGPVGGFFSYLQRFLSNRDDEVKRITFNGGDAVYALGEPQDLVSLKTATWDDYFEDLMTTWRPDAVVLFGDERPIHRTARRVAGEHGIPLWSFEEGYVRPDYVTFELGGNNANSTLPATFDPDAEIPEQPLAPRLTGQSVAMGLRAWGYFVALRMSRFLFPGYTHHRERRLRTEFRYWSRAFWRRAMSERHDRDLEGEIVAGRFGPFFILALQVHDDLQLRCHGRNWRTNEFTEAVLKSFRTCAPPDTRLVVKAHPLDVGYGHHRRNIRLLIERERLGDRVVFLQSGAFMPLVRRSRGLLTINSTAGIAALDNEIPVLAVGDALYQVPGLCNGPADLAAMDRFWTDPPPVDGDLAAKFAKHVKAEALIPGSFYLPDTWSDICSAVRERIAAHLAQTAPRPADPPEEAAAGPAAPIRIGIASAGVWRNRRAIATLLDADPVRLHRLGPFGPFGEQACHDLVGWGHKPTSAPLRALARRAAKPYVAIEDGFLRSVRPGAGDPTIGWIVDRTGIYYDARRPSDFEAAVARRAGEAPEAHARAAAALREIRDRRLSKYNHAPMLAAAALGLPVGRDVVVVVDQTRGDASVEGALADAATFERMLEAAVDENPGRVVAVKVHPETIGGTKRGHLLDAARRHGCVIVDRDVNPWALIEIAVRVYTVSSQVGLEALLAGVPVTCFGAAAWAGWGLTDDRFAPVLRRRARPTRDGLAAAAYLDQCRWLDPWDGRKIDLEAAIDRLAFLRDRFHADGPAVCYGFSRWKRRAVERFFGGGAGRPLFLDDPRRTVATAAERGARVVVWGSRAIEVGEDTPPPIRVEDGFLRSVGLGASFVAPASLIFDDVGIYYDPQRPSRFETLAAETTFDDALLARAAALRATIVERRLSKYNDSGEQRLDLPEGRLRVLVPGQVEDDASVRLGAPNVGTNLELLRRVRARWPDALIVYKPHPDVQAGFRQGRISQEIALTLADRVVTDVAMPALLAQVDRVETMTSLTGFEALLRGLPVATHGIPFYAGWGLCEDLAPCPRRTRRLSLDELVAVALVLYPRYVDPVTGLPCPVEVVIDRLSEERSRATTPFGRLRTLARNRWAWTAHNVFGPIWQLFK